jgi:diguanylate cyclase (GGDEF)-like protein
MRDPDVTDARLASYRTLIEVSRMLLGSATLEELFERIAGELKRLVPFDALTIYQVDELARMLVPLHSVDKWAEEIMDSPLPLGGGITGWVVEHGTAENLPSAHTDPRVAIVPGTPADEREALACVPLTVRDQTIGALNVYRLGENVAFDPDEFELICRFADLAALALENAQNRERLVQEAHTDWLTGLYNHRYFHERLREEVERAHRYGRPMSLLLFDLDDFKLLNDIHGHQEGDLVLRRVAFAARDGLRALDAACRVGGEEFAILLPEADKEAAGAAADRLCRRVRNLPGVRPVTVSCGVATIPGDASNPTEILAAADAALYAAKARGKDGVAGFSASVGEQRGRLAAAEIESLAHLRALGGLASRLNRLTGVGDIGETIVTELRGLVDYHNVRVYVVDDDDRALEPIAFRGELTEYGGETLDALRCQMGEGITGTAALTGRTLNVADAVNCEFAVDVPGTDEVDESILAVPLLYDGRTVGVIVLSMLGLGQFSPLAVRIMELLAAQAAVALENARLFEAQRRSAAIAEALLGIATMSSRDPSAPAVAHHVASAARELTGATGAAVVDTAGARNHVLALAGDESVRTVALAVARAYADAPGVTLVEAGALPARAAGAAPTRVAVAGVQGGVLVVAASHFSVTALTTIGAVAGQATLALRHAELLAQLRRAG